MQTIVFVFFECSYTGDSEKWEIFKKKEDFEINVLISFNTKKTKLKIYTVNLYLEDVILGSISTQTFLQSPGEIVHGLKVSIQQEF